MTLFIFALIATCGYAVHWGIGYFGQRGIFTSVPQHNEESGIHMQTMTFPVQTPQSPPTPVMDHGDLEDDDDEDYDDDDGVSYADDDVDYETHLRQIT